MISFLTESWFPAKRNGDFQAPDKWWILPRIIQSSQKMEERFMVFEEMLRDECAEGHSEGRVEESKETLLLYLQNLGTVL